MFLEGGNGADWRCRADRRDRRSSDLERRPSGVYPFRPTAARRTTALGKTVRITSIEIRAGPEPVYNLEVAGEHVYSVTGSGLLVHNSGRYRWWGRIKCLNKNARCLPHEG
nr:hypothetical protein [Gimesia maris]